MGPVMTRSCAVVLICLLGSLFSVQVQADEHWSAGFHQLTFLDPLDYQPMNAIAFYPSTDEEHVTQIQGYQVEAGEDATIAMGRFPLLMLSTATRAHRWPCMTWLRHWRVRVLW